MKVMTLSFISAIIFSLIFVHFDQKGGFFGASKLAVGECIKEKYPSKDRLKVTRRGKYTYEVVSLETGKKSIREYRNGFIRTYCEDKLE